MAPSASAPNSARPRDPFPAAVRLRLERARDAARAALRAERGEGGVWAGELASSALSTATAVTALTLMARGDAEVAARVREKIAGGYRWLVAHQNADGGWGDTPRSRSNISTTTLGWAALGLAPPELSGIATAHAAAERWLGAAAGSVQPDDLVRAIERRYGRDRTFSIPILTMCALCGRLGSGAEGWRRVRQLPFEVAVLPQRWFGALQLPVVSYALPALIAIGLVRHGRGPATNPLWRMLRDACRGNVLEKLVRLQPAHGGFLEATPLTSFVTMSLAGLGLTGHVVARRGTAFLEAAVRTDGSWPIDTNLATWLTTLSLQALGAGEGKGGEGPGADAMPAVRAWLLRQHYRVVHPYTLAAPGGWAWTDLPGGVPDADDTAGALLALRSFDGRDPAVAEAGRAGVGWLLDLQNRDGGVPTFCCGWGRLPFDRSSPDLTAHAVRAWLAWRAELPVVRQRRVEWALARAAGFLAKTQRADGAWVPLWFGHEAAPNDENPLYGTARVVPALCELIKGQVNSAGGAGGERDRLIRPEGQVETSKGQVNVARMLDRAVAWLVGWQNADGGWSGAAGAASSVEETGVAVEALAAAWACEQAASEQREAVRAALTRGALWLAAAVEDGRWREPAPIGFYFARLWYYERLYPLIFTTGALVRATRLDG